MANTDITINPGNVICQQHSPDRGPYAWSFVGASQGVFSSTSSLSVTLPSGIKVGDTIVVIVRPGANTISVAPSGYTQRTAQTGASPGLYTYTKVSDGTETTATCTLSGSTASCMASVVYRGFESAPVRSATANDSAIPYAAPSITTQNLDEAVISIWDSNGDATPPMVDWIVMDASLDFRLGSAYLSQPVSSGQVILPAVGDNNQAAAGASTARNLWSNSSSINVLEVTLGFVPMKVPVEANLSIIGSAPTMVVATGTVEITPNAGSASLAGASPAVVNGAVITPAVGSLAATGQTSTVVKGNVAIVSGALGMLLTGASSPQTITNTDSTGSAALSNVSSQPLVLLGTVVSPAVGTLTVSGASGRQDRGQLTQSGALTVSGNSAGISGTLVPQTGSLSISGAGALRMDLSLKPPTQSLAITGTTPGLNPQILTTKGSLTLAGAAPRSDFGLYPQTGSLALAASVLTRIVGTLVAPTTGALSSAGAAPQFNYSIRLTAGAFALTGTAPSRTSQTTLQGSTGALALTPGTSVINETVLTPSANLSLAGAAPVLTQGTMRVPVVAALNVVGTQAKDSIGTQTGQGTLALNGNNPIVLSTRSIAPATGEFDMAGEYPLVIAFSPVLSPESGVLSATGYLPDWLYEPLGMEVTMADTYSSYVELFINGNLQ